MVRWGTTSRQQSVVGTLATIADIATEKKITAPVITIIGSVVKLRSKLNWFEQRPLFGQRIVVTRTREQASQLARQLGELGAEILEIPTIKIAPPDARDSFVDALLELNSYSWLVFTSPNGVTAFFDLFFKQFKDLRDIGGERFVGRHVHLQMQLRQLRCRGRADGRDAHAADVAQILELLKK